MREIPVDLGSYSWPNTLTALGGGVLSWPHLVGGLGGAIIGFIVGELVNAMLRGHIHNVLLVGIHFAQLTLFIFVGLAVSEWAFPSLHPDNKMTSPGRFCVALPAMGLGMFFVLGCLFQFIYGLTPAKVALQRTDDYIIAIDNSGSTAETDPNKTRFAAVLELFQELDEDNNAAVIVFDGEANTVIPLGAVNNEYRINAEAVLNSYSPDGGTDIQGALRLAESLCNPARKSMVILLSDGLSDVDAKAITNDYNQKNIVLNAVGYAYNRFWGTRLLQKLSDMTGGTYYQVDDISQLSETMSQAASSRTPQRSLLSYRYGLDRKNSVCLIERILFIALLTTAMCVVLGFAAGEKDVGMYYWPQKAICGGVAGLVLELGLLAFTPEPLVRLAVALLMGLFLAMHRRLLETCHTDGQARSTAPLSMTGRKTPAGVGIGITHGPS